MKCICFSQDETFASKHNKTMIETREEWCAMKLPGSYLFNVGTERETKWKKYGFHYFGKLWPSPAFTVDGRQTTRLSSIVWNHTWCIVCKNTKTQPEKKWRSRHKDRHASSYRQKRQARCDDARHVVNVSMTTWNPSSLPQRDEHWEAISFFFCNFMMRRIHKVGKSLRICQR